MLLSRGGTLESCLSGPRRDSPGLHGRSTSRPRRRRDPSSRNAHVAAAASPRSLSTEYPRRGHGVAAIRLRGISTPRPRRTRDSSKENPRGKIRARARVFGVPGAAALVSARAAAPARRLPEREGHETRDGRPRRRVQSELERERALRPARFFSLYDSRRPEPPQRRHQPEAAAATRSRERPARRATRVSPAAAGGRRPRSRPRSPRRRRRPRSRAPTGSRVGCYPRLPRRV